MRGKLEEERKRWNIIVNLAGLKRSYDGHIYLYIDPPTRSDESIVWRRYRLHPDNRAAAIMMHRISGMIAERMYEDMRLVRDIQAVIEQANLRRGDQFTHCAMCDWEYFLSRIYAVPNWPFYEDGMPRTPPGRYDDDDL